MWSVLVGLSCLALPVTKIPGWAERLEWSDAPARQEGVTVLLDDRQVRATGRERVVFVHRALRPENTSGVAALGQLSVVFDPSYERAELHLLRISRNGRVIDRALGSRTVRLQREQQLEDNVYDGKQTEMFVLDDIRAGDILEVAYSVSGKNPVLGDHTSETVVFAHPWPTAYWRYRLTTARDSRLAISGFGDLPEVKEWVGGDEHHYTWELRDVKRTDFVADLPDDIPVVPVVVISDFESWQDVSRWASSLFPSAVGPTISRHAREIVAGAGGDSERALRLLRWVQDEVRYFSVALGESSLRPMPAEKTLARRYGDCKDKALLLREALLAIGIESSIAFVRTTSSGLIAQAPASVGVFDHAIVIAKVSGSPYWLDPTVQGELGPLSARDHREYQFALPLSEQGDTWIQHAHALRYDNDVLLVTTIEAEQEPTPSRVHIEARFSGAEARSFRMLAASAGEDAVHKALLAHYRGAYPELLPTDAGTLVDDAALGNFTAKRSFSLSTLWQEEKLFAVEPMMLLGYLSQPDPDRRQPLNLFHRSRVAEVTSVSPWPGGADAFDFETKNATHFRYSLTSRAARNTLNVSFRYETLRPRVEVDELPAYRARLADVRGHSRFTIPKEHNPFALNLHGLMLFLVVLGVAAGLTRVYYTGLPAPTTEREPMPLGGMLYLVWFGAHVTPVGMIAAAYGLCMTAGTWLAVGTIGNRDVATALGLAIAQCAMVAVSVLVLFLFRQRRAIFVGWYVGMLFAGAVLSISSSVIAGDATMHSARDIFHAMFWAGYMFVSERPLFTFVR